MDLRGRLVYLRELHAEDVDELLRLRLENRDFFMPFEPLQRDAHFTRGGQAIEIETSRLAAEDDRAYSFGIFDRADRLVGRIRLSNVVRGAWQNATLGYYIAGSHNNKGYATEAVRLTLRFAFGHARLHRVQAAVMPDNPASERVLEKAGFRYEGDAPRYLQIAGRWRDHRIYAITAEEAPPRNQLDRPTGDD